LVVAHILALHDVGSNNPDGVEIKKLKGPDGKPLDGIPFHPYYTVKDLVGAVVFLAIFCVVMFFVPEMGGYFLEHNNFIPADPLKTPEHIAPVWYFTPYYSILRAVPPLFNSQFPGVLAMGVAVVILFFLPWLDRSPVKSIRYRGPLYKSWLAAFVIVFIVLGYLGIEPTTVWGQFPVSDDSFLGRTIVDTKDVATWVARVCTIVYFLFFFLMPWYTARDTVHPVPERVTA
jgi:ubiquinol-cytochrome c reductase cytochrome b subunit